jgi:hypothetical protein
MPVTVSKYNSVHRDCVIGTIDLDDAAAGAFKLMLLGAGYTFSGTHTTVSDVVANEIANGNGYTAGGKALTNITLTLAGAVATFDADDVEWTAAGGSISARYAVLFYDAGAAGNSQRELMALVDFGQVETAAAGAPFKIIWPATGILRVQ